VKPPFQPRNPIARACRKAVSGSPAEDQQVKHLEVAISADGVFFGEKTGSCRRRLATLMDALTKESSG